MGKEDDPFIWHFGLFSGKFRLGLGRLTLSTWNIHHFDGICQVKIGDVPMTSVRLGKFSSQTNSEFQKTPGKQT